MGLVNPGRELNIRPDLKVQQYTALVVDNNDPEKRERVRIRIPQIHRNVPDDKLPWSMPMREGQAQAGSGVGAVRVPPAGSQLFVKYDADDPHNMYYGGSPTVDTVHEENELLDEDYPDTYGDVDQAGNKWSINTRQNTITFQHVSGTVVHIDGSGNVNIVSKKDINLGAKGDINIIAEGTIRSHAKGLNSIKGNPVLINGSNSGSTVGDPGQRTRPTIASPAGQTQL